MRPDPRRLTPPLLFLLACLLTPHTLDARAQEPRPTPAPRSAEAAAYDWHKYDDDPCGDPRAESDSWTTAGGTVVAVSSGDTFYLDTGDRVRRRVRLTGVGAPAVGEPFGPAAKRQLEALVLGKRVEVWVKPHDWIVRRKRPTVLTGVTHLRGKEYVDVGLALVGAGAARHVSPEPYTMSGYTSCRYGRAEEEARAAGRGLWRRQ